MKRFLISLGVMAAAALSLTNCTDEIENPVQEVEKVSYTIYANSDEETKTINYGKSTVWTEGDAMNVFHAEAGSTSYSPSSTFTLVDAETGEFSTEVLAGELSALNDWYAIYPYFVQTETPTKTRYLAIGAEASKTQTQRFNSNMAHIAGPNYPMWGSAKDVSAAKAPEIKMRHLSSLLKVVVTNGTSEDLIVASVSLTAEEDISGTYFIDFTGDVPTYTSSGDQYVSTVADLAVKEGEAIPSGGSAEFYLAVKPFTAKAGQKLTLAVNGVEKTIDLTKDVVFSPGKIKKLTFTCEEVITSSTVEDIIAAGAGQSVLAEGVVVATYAKGFLLGDDTGKIVVYADTYPFVAVGDKVEVLGTTTVYGGLVQISSPTTEIKSSGHTVTHPEPAVLDGAALEGMVGKTEISYVKYTGTLTVGNYCNVAVDGATGVMASIQYPLTTLGLTDLNGKTVTVEGYFIGVTGSSTKYVQTMAVSVTEETVVEPDPDPSIVPGPYTSNLVLTEEGGNKVYVDDSTVDGEIVKTMKLGTTTVQGSALITIPAGTTKIGFYAVAWNEKKAELALKLGETELSRVAIKGNAGASGSSNSFTITVDDKNSCYYEVEVNATQEGIYTFAVVKDYRAVIWGVNYYTAEGIGPDLNPEPEPEPEPEPTVTVKGSVSASLTAAGGEGTIEYEIANTTDDKVKVTPDASNGAWFSVEKTSAGLITYTATENTESSSRSAKFYVAVDGGNSVTVTVTQQAPAAEGTETIKVTFADCTAGDQYAVGEEHVINDVLTITTTQCHFTTELRLYSSSTHDGFVISNKLPGNITAMTFNMGYKADVLNVYGSSNGTDWTLIEGVTTTSSYKDYAVDFSTGSYTYFKLDVAGTQQIRIKTLSVTYQTN